MNIINQVEYDEWKEKQSGDGYGLGIFAFAERWGNAMEEKMSNGEKLEDIAKQTSYDVAEGITGFMYGCAVSILSQCWVHGEQLRKWHNIDTQIGTGGEDANKNGGTLNPALLNIQVNK